MHHLHSVVSDADGWSLADFLAIDIGLFQADDKANFFMHAWASRSMNLWMLPSV